MASFALKSGETVLVDDADYALVSTMAWHRIKKENGATYVVSTVYNGRKNKRDIRLHRMLMAALPGVEVDHRNGNGLDNRRENLRLATPTINRRSFQRKQAGSTSRFRGVSWCKEMGRWVAHIGFRTNGIKTSKFLGYFTDEFAAAEAYNRAAILYGFEKEALNAIAA